MVTENVKKIQMTYLELDPSHTSPINDYQIIVFINASLLLAYSIKTRTVAVYSRYHENNVTLGFIICQFVHRMY